MADSKASQTVRKADTPCVDSAAAPAEEGSPACVICNDVTKGASLLSCCAFVVCEACLVTYVSGKVSEGAIRVRCPRCEGFLEEASVKRILPTQKLQRRWRQSVVDASHDPSLKTCPGCGLEHRLPAEVFSSQPLPLPVTCGACAMRWCFPCHAPWHEGVTCAEKEREVDSGFKEWMRGGGEDSTLGEGEQQQQSNARQCPQCKAFIQRISSCPHMTCSVCLTDFCYQCGEQVPGIVNIADHTCHVTMRPRPGRMRLSAASANPNLGADLKWIDEAISAKPPRM